MNKPLLTALSVMLVTGMVEAAEPSRVTTPPNPDVVTTTDGVATTQGTLPDNTKINKRDKDERTVTPMDQSNAKADLDITQAIRKSIMKQDLSTNAKNVKVITQNGEVTLRGPVNSTEEVEKIIQIAKAVPSVKTLNNQLEVK